MTEKRAGKVTCRRHWPRGLKTGLMKLGYQISRRPLIGVARALSNWANDVSRPIPTIYLWRIEKRASGLHNSPEAPTKKRAKRPEEEGIEKPRGGETKF